MYKSANFIDLASTVLTVMSAEKILHAAYLASTVGMTAVNPYSLSAWALFFGFNYRY